MFPGSHNLAMICETFCAEYICLPDMHHLCSRVSLMLGLSVIGTRPWKYTGKGNLSGFHPTG